MTKAASSTEQVRARFEQALSGLISAFATDDYKLTVVRFENSILDLAIDAGPTACAECLVPEKMLTGLVRTALPTDADVTTIRIRYPSMNKGSV